MADNPYIPNLTREPDLLSALSVIMDPEIHVPITEMGLIYGVQRKNTTAHVTMTLTTIGCPLFDVIKKDIEDELHKVDGIESVEIELTFDPPWHTGMMSEEIQLELGIM